MCALSLSYWAAESFLQQFYLFCSSLALTKIILYFQQCCQVICPSHQPNTPHPFLFLIPLWKCFCCFCLKCGQSAQAAAPTCHLYFTHLSSQMTCRCRCLVKCEGGSSNIASDFEVILSHSVACNCCYSIPWLWVPLLFLFLPHLLPLLSVPVLVAQFIILYISLLVWIW